MSIHSDMGLRYVFVFGEKKIYTLYEGTFRAIILFFKTEYQSIDQISVILVISD
jgi:hypothetical protein